MHFPKLLAPLAVLISLGTALPTPGEADVDRPFAQRWTLPEKREPADVDSPFSLNPFSFKWNEITEKRDVEEES
ncbi:hypothetical protein LIA77_02746 [Sarocladium implicatum]|nr:hypothetical protein LIA77_02746 [Sarocladium implicatum]